MDAVEDTLLYIGTVSHQPLQERLDLLPLGTSAAVIAHGAVFCESAGALDKLQLIVSLPRQNILLVGAVKRTDQFHSLKVGAVKLLSLIHI